MAKYSLLLKITLAVLMIDALIELGFLSSMVRWLNYGAGGPYKVLVADNSDTTFLLQAAPANLLVNQGHTSNAAGGTAFVLAGVGGIIALWLRSRSSYATSRFSVFWYRAWLVLLVPATMLTLAALIYVNVVTAQHAGQEIDVALAAALPDGAKYPDETWTPQGWFSAVLRLPLADDGARDMIAGRLRVMVGWRWNLIPLFVIETAVAVLAWVDAQERRSRGRVSWKMEREAAGLERESANMI